jgi:homospermidine synthase
MVRSIKKQSFEGNIIMVGCGSIGQALLPLIHRHIENMHGCITVLSASESGRGIAERNGAQFIHSILTPGSYRNILNQYVRKGDFLLNMSVGVSSMDLIRFCYEKKMLYVDTSIEPWPGVFDNPMLELQDRTNYAIRNKLLKLATELGSDSPTAIVDHGANPGIVSHFVKQALISLNHQFGNPPVFFITIRTG